MQLLTVAPSPTRLMDKWIYRQEIPLVVQLPTVAVMAIYCLIHFHVLVKLMECGQIQLLSVIVSY